VLFGGCGIDLCTIVRRDAWWVVVFVWYLTEVSNCLVLLGFSLCLKNRQKFERPAVSTFAKVAQKLLTELSTDCVGNLRLFCEQHQITRADMAGAECAVVHGVAAILQKEGAAEQ